MEEINVHFKLYIVLFSKKLYNQYRGRAMVDFSYKNTNLILNKAISQAWKINKYSYKNIARPVFGLLYLFAGHIIYTFDNCVIELKPGDIIFLPKGSNYEVNFDIKKGKVEDFLINFDIVGNGDFSDIHELTCILNDSTKALFTYFKDVIDAYREKDKPFLTNAYFYLCLDALQTVLRSKNSNEELLIFKKAAKMLAENIEMSVDEISRDMHMSRSAFQKKFKEYFGTSPIEYRMEKRIEKARLLLQTTDMPIKEIADSLGFYDTAYFYRIFEKRCLLTPKKYRETVKPDL